MHNPYAHALEYLVEAGAGLAVQDDPHDRFASAMPAGIVIPTEGQPHRVEGSEPLATIQDPSASGQRPFAQDDKKPSPLQPHAEIIKQAEDIAAKAETLDELRQAIQNFDGLSVKKTATQIVFADGNPSANVMVIGEAPGADEDRQGKPFVGVSGQLLDKIFACIGLSRESETPDTSLYISNILNWRPPGNRTPTAEEMQIATPFIQKHTELIKPKIIVLCGGVAAQTILQSKDSISRLRGRVQDLDNGVKAVATYHPAFLLRTPIQKKKVWHDMLLLQDVMHEA